MTTAAEAGCAGDSSAAVAVAATAQRRTQSRREMELEAALGGVGLAVMERAGMNAGGDGLVTDMVEDGMKMG